MAADENGPGRRRWLLLGRRRQKVWPLMESGEYRSYRAIHPFDERHGVETSGLLYDLETGHPHDLHNNGYFAVAPSVFHGVLLSLRERLKLDFEQFTFVDIGSGKGRALLLASDYPFRKVIGIELSPDLDRVARANIARYTTARQGGMKHPPIIAVQGDATEFAWPAEPLIVYMWNSFAQPVLEQVLANLEDSLSRTPRDLYLIYMHPEHESAFSHLSWLRRIWQEEFPMTDEDYQAWAFPTSAEVCSLYQSVSTAVSVSAQGPRTKV